MGKFDERIEEFGLLVGAHETARRVEEIPLDRVIPDPGNPRRSFDDDALAELAASIAARGVLQPITVAPADAAGLHRIRLGERRFRASELAGRVTIPAIVVAEGREPICSPIRSLRTISVRTFLRSSSLMRLPVCSRAA
jgi:ParB family chromosome partitioning protein